MVAPTQSLSKMFSFFTVYDQNSWLGIFGVFVLFLLVGCVMYWFGFKYIINKKRNVGNVSDF